jgi:hypothetical protein
MEAKTLRNRREHIRRGEKTVFKKAQRWERYTKSTLNLFLKHFPIISVA